VELWKQVKNAELECLQDFEQQKATELGRQLELE